MVALNQTSPPDRTRPLARESGDRLSPLADRDLEVRVTGLADPITLPAAAVRVLVDTLNQLAGGGTVSVVTTPADYSVAEAAVALDLPQSYLTREIDEGNVAVHGSDNGHRIRAADVAAFRRVMYGRRLAALAELTALDEELGLL